MSYFKKKHWDTRNLIVAVVAFVTACIAPATAAAQTEDIEEITVTARKRTETIQEIPESVSVLDSFTLEQSNISRIDDIGLRISNLNLSTRADGNPNVTIRGIGSFGNTQGVGFYVDGVQIFSDASAEFGDIERVEVLKGPQGTLYGGNNIGGAVKFVSKRPDLGEFSGDVGVEAGGQDTLNVDGVVNVPLSDNFAARLFAYRKENEGYVDAVNPTRLNGRSNIADSGIWPVPLVGAGTNFVPDSGSSAESWRSKPNESDEWGTRLSLLGNFGESWSLFATVRYNELDAGNNNWRAEDPTDLRYSTDRELTFAGRNLRDTFGASLELSREMSAATLTYLGSVTDAEGLRTTDLDVSSEVGFDLVRPEETDVQTHEIRLTSSGDGAFEWLVGVYYSRWHNDWASYATFYETTDVLSAVIPASDTLNILDGVVGDTPLPPTFAQETTVRVPFPFENRDRERTNTAIFAAGSYTWDKWELGIGFRVDDWETDTLDRNAGLYATGVPYLEQGDTDFLPKVSLSYFHSDRSHVYLSYSQGFEPGGYNLYDSAGTPLLNAFQKETTDNFEIGWKANGLDGRLDFNIAAFYIDYTDRQFELQQQIAIGGVVENILNAGDSDQFGAEFDFSWAVNDYWTITGGAGFVDAEFGDGSLVNDVNSQPSDVSGRTPPWISDYSYILATQVDYPLSDGLRFLGRFEVIGKGDYFFNQENTAEHPAYELANLRLGIESDRWSIAVNVENVFDEDYYTDGSVWPGDAVPGFAFDPVIGTLGQPRLVTGEVRVRF